ncbi:MAG: hypothetical protein H6Q67_2141 [Firmicutes bacterium]|nr:hypothetical protein [Bacillota bacterium]
MNFNEQAVNWDNDSRIYSGQNGLPKKSLK